MIKRTYSADVSSIALIHKRTNVKVLISNFYGDGDFNYYILESEEQLPVRAAREVEVWFERPSEWKIMDWDCSRDSTDVGYEIDSNVWSIRILRHNTTFYFILRR